MRFVSRVRPVYIHHYRLHSNPQVPSRAGPHTKFVKNSFWGRGRWLLAVIWLVALLVACTPGGDSPRIITATPASAATRVAAAAAQIALPANVNPLTGLPVRDPAALARRPLAAKISNAPDSVRPQAGIGAADLVFEHYVEAGLTRFTAIFWAHTPSRVGSIRSARLIDLEIPAMYGALLVYSGASEPIRQRIAALPFAPRAYEGVTSGAPLYFRDPSLDAPHNLFAVPAEVWARARADGLNDPPDLRGMVFDPTPPGDSAPATVVTIDYGPDEVQWRYDSHSGEYARWVDGEPHTDADSGAQVTAANVVILYARHQDDESIVEGEWNGTKFYSTEIELQALGPAMLIRDGVAVDGFWMRWAEGAPLTLWADEGAAQPLAFKPGITWFQVVPLDFSGLRLE